MTGKFISRERLGKLKEELEYLKSVRRQEIADKIREAKDQGDLSENAEYAEAKEEQAFVEGRILELENTIKNSEIFDNQQMVSSVITIGSTIKVKEGKNIIQYTIVGSDEANPSLGKISNESPIGRAFLNKKKGDIVEAETPRGTIQYKIVSVFY